MRVGQAGQTKHDPAGCFGRGGLQQAATRRPRASTAGACRPCTSICQVRSFPPAAGGGRRSQFPQASGDFGFGAARLGNPGLGFRTLAAQGRGLSCRGLEVEAPKPPLVPDGLGKPCMGALRRPARGPAGDVNRSGKSVCAGPVARRTATCQHSASLCQADPIRCIADEIPDAGHREPDRCSAGTTGRLAGRCLPSLPPIPRLPKLRSHSGEALRAHPATRGAPDSARQLPLKASSGLPLGASGGLRSHGETPGRRSARRPRLQRAPEKSKHRCHCRARALSATGSSWQRNLRDGEAAPHHCALPGNFGGEAALAVRREWSERWASGTAVALSGAARCGLSGAKPLCRVPSPGTDLRCHFRRPLRQLGRTESFGQGPALHFRSSLLILRGCHLPVSVASSLRGAGSLVDLRVPEVGAAAAESSSRLPLQRSEKLFDKLCRLKKNDG